MVIPLLANQDFNPMLSQHYWQEFFDGDSFVSQSRFEPYASKPVKILLTMVSARIDLTQKSILKYSVVV